jgi:hypothetical protein
MSLADNFGDKPRGGVSVGDAVLVGGGEGVYCSLGDYGAQMTPFAKVSGSYGFAGKYAFDRWKDDNGTPGVAYVAPNGQAYFSVPGEGSVPGATVCLTESIRDGEHSLKTYLLDGQSSLGLTDYSTAQVKVNERDDTLTIIMGKRGLKLRRPDQSGRRNWEPEYYNTGGDSVTVRFVAGAAKYGLRWMRSDGKADEDEYDNAARQYIEGVNRDGGSPMPIGYWRSKTFAGKNRRIRRVFIERTKAHQMVKVRVRSDRLSQVYQIPPHKNYANCLPMQQGHEHQFEILLDEETGEIQRLHWEEEILNKAVSR